MTVVLDVNNKGIFLQGTLVSADAAEKTSATVPSDYRKKLKASLLPWTSSANLAPLNTPHGGVGAVEPFW
jgi:hypothetical protein